MYRFFGSQSVPIQNASFMSRQTIMQRSVRICSFCNYNHRKVPKSVIYHQIRGSASTINLLELQFPVKKKMKHRLKNYAELLEVTDQATSNRKAAVQKLNSADLSILVKQPEITMDKLHKLRDRVFTKSLNTTDVNANNVISHKGDIMNSDVLPHSAILQHWNEPPKVIEHVQTVDKTNKLNILNTEVQKIRNVLGTVRKSEKSVQGKENSVANNSAQTAKKYESQQHMDMLLAHIDVYLYCGMLNEASKVLRSFRLNTTCEWRSSNNSIKLYNAVMEAHASKGDFETVLNLYNIIKTDGVRPTPHTYTIIFDAFTRKRVKNNQTQLLKKIQSEMRDYNISFNDIFNESHFQNNQQENVLTAIKLLQPDYEPLYTVPDLLHSCEILYKEPSKKNGLNRPAKPFLTIEELEKLLKEQIKNESQASVVVKSIERFETSADTVLQCSQKVNEVEEHWEAVISKAFDNNLNYLKEKERHLHSAMPLHPFLQVLDKEQYTNAILHEIRQITRGSQLYSVPMSYLYLTLGKHIYEKYEMQKMEQTGMKKKFIAVYKKYLEWYTRPGKSLGENDTNHRAIWQMLEHEQQKCGAPLSDMCVVWPKYIQKSVGKFLYDIILHDVILKPGMIKSHDLKHSIPAFYTLFRNEGQYLTEQVKAHPFVMKMYKDLTTQTLTFDTILVPSCCPPRPWTTIQTGGYLISKADFVRTPDNSIEPLRKLEDTPVKELYPIFDSLNQLGSVPWTINSPVLDIIIKIFQDGGSEELNVPLSPSVLPPIQTLSRDASKREKTKVAKAQARRRRQMADLHSLRCDALYKLSLANHFRDKIFWLPHNVDFRGRVYPMPPHLNHLTSDLGRALLLFAQGKPLGPKGLDWLKLHAINLTGLKKRSSIKDRLLYANEVLDDIIESAENPLTGKMWWAKSDEPWQTLAVCMEIANAIRSGKPQTYECKFPVHQDGSCNGLQHYAALGRDQIGAESVNLCPFDTPKDVYNEVATEVELRRKADAENGVVVAQQLEGCIQRKVIKQTVMTTVYGVTKYGAKYQIMKQLVDVKGFPQESIRPASYYLADKTFESIGSVFKSARLIQNWFIDWARMISACGAYMEWVTPLGFPIVQSYSKNVKVKNGKKNPLLQEIYRKPNTMKQRNAFPPNFIHSLDSTHMMLTSLHCHKMGVTFVSVHDCYWTHACTVDIMNKVCREQFVALHSQPILENLAEYLAQHYTKCHRNLQYAGPSFEAKKLKRLQKVPQKGEFDIKQVLSSTYFFS